MFEVYRDQFAHTFFLIILNHQGLKDSAYCLAKYLYIF